MAFKKAEQLLDLCVDDNNELATKILSPTGDGVNSRFYTVDQIFNICFDSETNSIKVVEK